jgi:integrase
LKEEIKSLGRGIVRAVEEKVKFEDLMRWVEDNYKIKNKPANKNLPSYRRNLAKFFGGMRAIDIDGKTDAYIAKRQGETKEKYTKRRLEEGTDPAAIEKEFTDNKVGNATINRELACLKRGFALAVKAKKLHSKLETTKLKEPPPRQGFIEFGDFNRVSDSIRKKDPDVNDLNEFIYATGWRSSAAKDLEWKYVFEKESVIRLPDEDSNKMKPGITPIVGKVAEIIARRKLVRRLDCPYVFHRNGKKIKDYRRTWQSACAAAGLGTIQKLGKGRKQKRRYKGVMVHDQRRSFAKNSNSSGVPEAVTMALGGWKTRSVFDRYRIVDKNDLIKAALATDKYLEQSTESKVTPIKKAESE